MDRLLSTAEVARLLSVTRSTIDGWARSARGPRFYRVGKSRRYREADVLVWLEANATEPAR